MSMRATATLFGGGLRSEIDVNGRHTILTDEPERLGGGDAGPAPHELLPAIVASCITTTLAMYARTKKWDLGDIVVDVDYDSEATPRRLRIDVRLPSGLSEMQLQRLERVARTCPIRRSLEAGFEFEEELHTAAAPAPAADAGDLEVRPIEPGDKQTMIEGFQRLSDESRYRRFLAPHGRLTAAELRYFTEVDHHDHEALVAIDPRTEHGIGVARYIRSQEDPAVAELAVAVIDDWQARGVGSRLVAALAERAREEGISRFSAYVLADNELMINLLEDLGNVQLVNTEHGTAELTVELSESGIDRLRRLLGAIARGELIPSGKLGRRGHQSAA
jgi:putative redox protein